jgi:hypothetical protein
MPLEPTKEGLLARAGDYEPLRAFSQGGFYWDRVPQQLIRESDLAEFLPPVEVEKDDRGKYGRFHLEQGRRELLTRSKPLGRRRIPPDQLRRLQQAIADFNQKAEEPGAQQQNRELIQRFRLPNLALEPELYRFAGPWWNRRLQILWGCERTRDSSLPLTAAAEKLEADRFYNLRRLLGALLLLLLLFLPAWWLCSNWGLVQSWLAQGNKPPTAAVGNVPPDRQAAAEAERALTNAARAEADAQKAEAEAQKARANSDRAREQADAGKADVEHKRKEADDALAAAKKAEETAKQARAASDRAKADAAAAQKAAERANAQKEPALQPATKPLAGTPAPQGPLPFPTAKSSPPSAPGDASPSAPGAGTTPSPPGGETPAAGGAPTTSAGAPPPQCQIVLCGQGQPAPDGTMAISLEVRPVTDPARSVPVETWDYDGQTVKSINRLQANLKGGDHLIKAAVLDASGQRAEIQAVVTVEPGKVITTPGNVTLRPKPGP